MPDIIVIKPQKPRKKLIKRIFIITMIAYPLIHFLVFWLYVNIDSIMLTFMRHYTRDAAGNPISKYAFIGFNNYANLFYDIIHDPNYRAMIWNSFLFFPVTCLITVPLSVGFSYFLFKKMPVAGVFRVIFFLPSLLPVTVLALSFKMGFDPLYGFVNSMLRSLSITAPNWFGKNPWTQAIVFIYCVWAGLGYNIVLLSGAMGRVPKEVIEYGRLEGISMRNELFKVMIPMIWPTITTLIVLAMTSVLTVFLQPLLLTDGIEGSSTISLEIYKSVRGNDKIIESATLGLTMSVLFAPVIMLVRHFLSKLWSEVDY